MKRLRMLLILLLCAALLVPSASAEANPAFAQDDDLAAAVEAGVIQQSDLTGLNESVTRRDFYQALQQSVALNKTPCEATRTRAGTMDDSFITRNDAASLIYSVVLENYFGLDTSEGNYAYDCFEYAKTLDAYHNRCGEAQPCMEFAESQRNPDMDFDVWSVGYCCLQYDPYTLRNILEVDGQNYFRIGETLTREEAWKAAVRLYRAYKPSELLALDEIRPLQLTDGQAALAAEMPDAAYNALPAWKGTALDNKSYKNGAHHTGGMYTASDFEILHDLGFNFTRIMITHELLFDLTDGVKVQQGELDNLDDAIGYAIANGVHICICLADFPGFAGASMDDEGFSGKALLANITAAYSILAKRYQHVPNSVLSFNLFNEPWKITKKREKAYVKAVHAVSEGIWQYGDRLIFVDGIAGSQEPVQSLAKEHYAQAFHMYVPDQFIYSGWVGETTWYAGEQWPLPYANGFLGKGASLTL